MTRIRVIQNKTLRLITGASWHVRNESLHVDLKVKQVDEVFSSMSRKFVDRLLYHDNPEARKLATDPYRPSRLRLRRPRYLDMLQNCFPVQRISSPQHNNTISNDQLHANTTTDTDSPHTTYHPSHILPGRPASLVSSRPAYRHFLETGEMDDSFGNLRHTSGLMYMSARFRALRDDYLNPNQTALTRVSSPTSGISNQSPLAEGNSSAPDNPVLHPSEQSSSSQQSVTQSVNGQETNQ
jgi:hypothetical protein